MTDHAVINIAVQAILLATKLAAPILGVSLAIGLVIVLLLRRPVDILATRMNRTVAVLICYLAVIAVLAMQLLVAR